MNAHTTAVVEKADESSGRGRLALAALGLLVLATWIVQRPYRGLNHDSVIYSFLALVRLHPVSLAHDLIVRFGSQDSYTVFSPLYAAAIRALDLEPAAALLTFAGQVAFFVAAWALARRAMSPRLALLAVGLLIALPSNYGARQAFGYIEGFLTPRQMAEALVLASLAATLAGRRILGGIFLGAGLLLHPIMAFTGVVALFFLYIALPRPRLAVSLGSVLVVVSLAVVLLFPVGPLGRFEPDWLAIADSFGYLFVSQWTLKDWGQLCLPAGILILGATHGTSSLVRRLCSAALMTAAAGIVATLIFCDLLHVVIVTQVQPWRWVWLAHVVALLLLPLIVSDCWRTGSLGRAAILLLISASLLRDLPIAPPCVVLAALGCAAGASRVTNARQAHLVLLGSVALLVVAALINLLPHTLSGPVGQGEESLPTRLALGLNKWAGDGLLFSVILALVLGLRERGTTSTNAAILVLALAFVCVLAPVAWRSWTSYQYTPALHARYSKWREAIPEQAEVFWTTSPVASWYLLERPDYWTPQQAAGDIFSRTQALATQRRAQLALTALEATGQRHPPDPDPQSPWHRPPQQMPAENLDAPGLSSVCTDPDLSFVVSRVLLGPTSYPEVTPDPAEPDHRLYLYRCSDVRQSAAQPP